MPLWTTTTAAGPVRMGVALRGLAVRGPARVADADLPAHRLVAQHALQVRELAERAPHLDLALVEDRDARRVVAAVLEAAQPVDQDVHARGGHDRRSRRFHTSATPPSASANASSAGTCPPRGGRFDPAPWTRAVWTRPARASAARQRGGAPPSPRCSAASRARPRARAAGTSLVMVEPAATKASSAMRSGATRFALQPMKARAPTRVRCLAIPS